MLNHFIFIAVTSFTSFCRLHSDILAETSSILLYLFLRNIFVTSDIKIKEENLFCDNIKGNEIFPSQQVSELKWLKMCWFLFIYFLIFQVRVLLRLHILVCEWAGRPLDDREVLLDVPCRFHQTEFMYFLHFFNLSFFPCTKVVYTSNIKKCTMYKMKPIVILLPLRMLWFYFHIMSLIFKNMRRQICYCYYYSFLQKWDHDLLAVLQLAYLTLFIICLGHIFMLVHINLPNSFNFNFVFLSR